MSDYIVCVRKLRTRNGVTSFENEPGQTRFLKAMFPPIVVLLTPYVYRATDVPYKVEI